MGWGDDGMEMEKGMTNGEDDERRKRIAGNTVASLLFESPGKENSLSNHITRAQLNVHSFSVALSGFSVGKDSMLLVEVIAAALQCIGSILSLNVKICKQCVFDRNLFDYSTRLKF